MTRSMSNKPLTKVQEDKNNPKETAAIDLNLVNCERIGDLIFLIGTILAFVVADQSELSILQTELQKKQSLAAAALRTLSLESWLFLIASIIFTNIATVRLRQLEIKSSQSKTASDIELLYGNKIATLGSAIKTIGFTITAIGNQLKYESTKKQ